MNKYRLLTTAIVRLQTNLDAFELSNEVLKNKYNIDVVQMDLKNERHVSVWCDIINHSYTEFNYDITSARRFFNEDKIHKNVVTYLFSMGRPSENLK